MGTRLLQSAISLFSTTQMYGGPFVSLRSRHMKVIWAQTTRHARYTRVSSSHAPFFLVPRYYLHAPATQAIPLPSVRQGSHDPCGDEIGTLRTNALTDPHNHWYVYLCTCFLPFMSGTINFLLKLKAHWKNFDDVTFLRRSEKQWGELQWRGPAVTTFSRGSDDHVKSSRRRENGIPN